MCRHPRLINIAKHVGAFLNTHCCKTLVDCKVDASDLTAVHTLECDQITTLIRDRDAHWDTDLSGFGPRPSDRSIRVVYV